MAKKITMKIDWTVKFGDILTSVTIVVSVIALLLAWSKDRTARETENADKVRYAASMALTKLDRWQLLNLSLYQDLQPVFVGTSEKLSEQYDVIKVRDYLWKTINIHRTSISKKVLDEQIYTSYIGLLSHFPDSQEKFQTLFDKLIEIENSNSDRLLSLTERDVLSFKNKQEGYTTAMLGNTLRNSAKKQKEDFKKQTDEAINPIKDFLFNIVSKSNQEILY